MNAQHVNMYCPKPDSLDEDRVATFTLSEQGVVINVLNEQYAADLEKLKRGVAVYSLRRVVRPEEGAIYLEGLLEHFRNSSYYRFEATDAEHAGRPPGLDRE